MQNANEVWGRNPADIIRENPDPLVIAGVYAQMIKDEETQFRMLQASENDAFAFARNFIYTYNEITRCIEIIPDYDYLRETVFPGLHSPGNRLWEKCQRMLVTISATAYFFAEWMTQDGFMAWMTSRKETKVDDGGGHSTWDSLFGKLRFYYEQMARRTPWAIEHFIGSVPRSDNLFKYMNAVNKTRNSVIYGEAPITTAPTGSGFVKALVDEAAVVPQLRSIHGNLMMACPNGTHYVSYPDGDGNHFAKVRNTEGHFSFEIVTLPYYLNPMHDEKWLADQERMLTKEEFGRRVMISYSTSVRGRVWPSFSRTNNTVVNLSFDPNALMCWFDFGFVDATSVGIVQIGKDEFGGEIKPVILVKAWLEVDHTKYKEVAKSLKDRKSVV